MSKDRGFKKLVGKTIRSVNTKAINEVLLVDEDGYFYAIEAEAGPLGLPVITLKKLKLNKYGVPEQKLKPLQRAKKKAEDTKQWPFPIEKDPSLD